MSITPNGGPAWEKSAGSSTYGGAANKTNFQSQGSINSRTDVSVAEFVRMTEDLRAVVATSDFAAFSFTADDTSPDDPTITEHLSMTATQPTGTRVSDGVTRWTWPASVNDAYSQGGNVHIIGARAQLLGSTAGITIVELEDPDGDGRNERIKISVFATGGSALTDASVAVKVTTGPV